MREFKIIEPEGEASPKEIIKSIQASLDDASRIETIDSVIEAVEESIYAEFKPEQAAAIISLVQTSLEVCASKWCIDKED